MIIDHSELLESFQEVTTEIGINYTHLYLTCDYLFSSTVALQVNHFSTLNYIGRMSIWPLWPTE